MITLEEAQQKGSLRRIKSMETTIWKDIFRARRSLAIIEPFIAGLKTKFTNYQWNENLPMINALWASAIDSIVICLGRLLNPKPKIQECTLARYRNTVLEYLRKYGPELNESEHAKKSLNKLKNRDFLKALKLKHQKFCNQIMPWRDKVTAHSELDADVSLPKNLNEMVAYAEEIHSICHSAMEDAGGPYIFIGFVQKDIR
jgi:hypothetical protein